MQGVLRLAGGHCEDGPICLLLALYESVIENWRPTPTAASLPRHVHRRLPRPRLVHTISVAARVGLGERRLLREVRLVQGGRCRGVHLLLRVDTIAGQGRGLVVVGLIVSLVHFI